MRAWSERSRSRTWRLARAAGSILLLASAQTAGAGTYSLTGDARFQAGNGLPVPITSAPAPAGAVLAIPGATAMQTAGPDPRQITLSPGQLTAPGAATTIGLGLLGSAVFQIRTSFAVAWPAAAATLRAGGRTGPPVVTFCAGDTVTPSHNPMCTGPGAPGNSIHGLMRYTKTLSQFGGPASASFGGGASGARRVSAPAPCQFATNPGCLAIFYRGMAPAAPGGAFGATVMSAGTAPNPGLFRVNATGGGRLTAITPTGLAPGLANPAQSFAGPWTTGRVTVSITNPTGGASQVFIFTGSDTRVGGVGSLSLVAGSIGYSMLGGPSANRGWVSLTLADPAAVPGLATRSLASLAALLGVGGLAIAQRRRRISV